MQRLPVPVTLYSKPGCHLCDDAEELLDELACSQSLAITSVDITQDFELHRRYWDRIPVAVIGATEIGAPITRADLQRALEVYDRER